MKIIGHRGAAGLALENTLESIKVAKEVGVDAIEIDARLTSDGRLVLCHDPSVSRVSNESHIVKKHSYDKIKEILLHNGESVPSLQKALKVAGDTPLVIEMKGSGWSSQLAKLLIKANANNSIVISYDHGELLKFTKLMPNIQTYSIERTKAFEALQLAKIYHFTGVDFNYWLLNPLTYLIAKRKKLKIIVYTVNSPRIAWLLSVCYPDIAIATDYPNKMQFLRKPSKGL